MRLRETALGIWRAVLAAGDPGPLVARWLGRAGGQLRVGDLRVDLDRLDRVLVLGCGKAAAAMAVAAERVLDERITGGFVVVKDGHAAPLRSIAVAEAGHPVPDARGVAAAQRLLALAGDVGPDDLVLFLVSGGGSALTPAPAPPVTLDEKQQITRLLLAAGATIGELNAVRKHLSLLKGGQLARAVAPARLISLILSDVIGDPLDVIASGPTAPDASTFAEALAVLRDRGVQARAPRAVRERLEAGARGELPETPKPGDPVFEHVTNLVIGNNALVTDTAVTAARAAGYTPSLLTRELQGEARDAARRLVEGTGALEPPVCLIAAGETTVTVRGTGRGGRCQEFALAAALAIAGRNDIAVLAAGTDGTDGPTDAAGAVVDGGTIGRGTAAGVDAGAALSNNDAYAFLRSSGDLIVSGPTSTNLLDLYLVLRT